MEIMKAQITQLHDRVTALERKLTRAAALILDSSVVLNSRKPIMLYISGPGSSRASVAFVGAVSRFASCGHRVFRSRSGSSRACSSGLRAR